jgi:hypothetical protein
VFEAFEQRLPLQGVAELLERGAVEPVGGRSKGLPGKRALQGMQFADAGWKRVLPPAALKPF